VAANRTDSLPRTLVAVCVFEGLLVGVCLVALAVRGEEPRGVVARPAAPLERVQPEPPDAVRPPAADPDELAELRARVAALEGEVRRLREERSDPGRSSTTGDAAAFVDRHRDALVELIAEEREDERWRALLAKVRETVRRPVGNVLPEALRSDDLIHAAVESVYVEYAERAKAIYETRAPGEHEVALDEPGREAWASAWRELKAWRVARLEAISPTLSDELGIPSSMVEGLLHDYAVTEPSLRE
jgi:hypothetical protein